MGKFGIIVFSGTTDKLTSVGVLAQAAASLGEDVEIFVTFWGLLNFLKGEKKFLLPKEFESFGPQLMKGMKEHNVKSWYDMIKDAKEMGAKVYACSLACDVFGLKKEDLDPIVDNIVGAATFISDTENGRVIFI